MENGAFRKKKVYFSQVSNLALRDSALSLKAKGLYALIQSYITIEGFTLYKNTLRQSCKEGEAAFENAWSELKAQGYLKQYKIRVQDGTFCYEYELLDEKAPENAENSDSDHTPKNQGVDNSLDGKVGVYKNTDPNNTDLKNIEKEYNAAPANGFANADTVKGFSKGAQKPRAESATFSAELQNFVDATYPALFEQYNGYQHPRLKPYQRVRTLTILRDYLQDYTESIDALESAAEEFVSDGESDGNILAFANPQTIEIRLNRC